MKVRINLNYILALTLIIALAFPIRIWWSFGPFESFSPMDIVLIIFLIGLLLLTAYSGILRVGNRYVAVVLTVPVFFCFLSFLWTVNPTETLKAALTYTEALATFFITILVFGRLSSNTIACLLGIFVLSTITAAFLSETGFPGLSPQIPPNLMPGSLDYAAFILSYHVRLSHPFIGLSNNFATVLAFFPIMFSSYAKATRKPMFHWLAALSILAVVLTLSRGVILALFIAYGFYYGVRHQISLKSLLRGVALLVIIIFCVFAYVKLNPQVEYNLPDRLSTGNIHIRLEAWYSVLATLAEHPFRGYGAGVSVSEVTGFPLRSTHNAFLSQLFYFGLPCGIIAAGSVLIIPFLFIRWRLSSNKARFMRRAVVFTLIGQMLIFASQASFAGSVLRVLFYFSVAASITLLAALEREAVFSASVSDNCG